MKNQNTRLNVGLVGLGVHLTLNLLGIFVFHRAAAVFFSEQWWSAWFPLWLVWTVLAVTGMKMPVCPRPRFLSRKLR